jgi:O-antigen/teichoic acid export membrane protein
MHDLRRRMAAGAAWMIFFRGATRLLGVISTVILARLLVPEDFGLMAVATAIVAGLELMSAFSFDIALIQHQDSTRSHYDTAWTITILFSVATALLLVVLAGPGAAFYEDGRLETIMYVLAAGTVVEGFQNVGIVAFRKDMDFRKEFLFQVGKKLISFAVTLPLAFLWRDYWALVIGLVAGKLGGTLLSFAVHPYRPRFALSAHVELFRFSRWLVLNNLLGFLRHRAPDFIVGKLAGPGPLGLFTLSYELAQLPTTELVAPINRAVYPAYARISSDLSRLQHSYLEVVGMIAFFALPAAAGIAVIAEPLVTVVLGPRWLDAVPLIQVLGLAGAVNALETNIGSVYLALGRPQILSRLYGFFVALIVVLVVAFTWRWGVVGAAWGCLLAAVLNIPVYYGAMITTLRMSVGQVIDVVWRPLVAAGGMSACVVTVLGEIGATWSGVPAGVELLAGVVTGVLTYAALVLLLWSVSGRPGGSAEGIVVRRLAGLTRLAGDRVA